MTTQVCSSLGVPWHPEDRGGASGEDNLRFFWDEAVGGAPGKWEGVGEVDPTSTGWFLFCPLPSPFTLWQKRLSKAEGFCKSRDAPGNQLLGISSWESAPGNLLLGICS